VRELEGCHVFGKLDCGVFDQNLLQKADSGLADAGLAVGQAQEVGPSHFGESTEHGFGIHQPDAAEPSGRPDTCCGRRPWCPPQVLSPLAAGLREKTKFDVAIGGVRL
jgi:hypothetical protein